MGSTSVFSTVFVLLIHSKAIVGDRNLKAIDHLQVLARHGERYPLFPVPELGEFVVSPIHTLKWKSSTDRAIVLFKML